LTRANSLIPPPPPAMMRVAVRAHDKAAAAATRVALRVGGALLTHQDAQHGADIQRKVAAHTRAKATDESYVAYFDPAALGAPHLDAVGALDGNGEVLDGADRAH